MPNTDWFGNTEILYKMHTIPAFTNLTVTSRKQPNRRLQNPVTEDMIEEAQGRREHGAAGH